MRIYEEIRIMLWNNRYRKLDKFLSRLKKQIIDVQYSAEELNSYIVHSFREKFSNSYDIVLSARYTPNQHDDYFFTAIDTMIKSGAIEYTVTTVEKHNLPWLYGKLIVEFKTIEESSDCLLNIVIVKNLNMKYYKWK